ncbi:hypothetical protein JCM3775_003787 [Rhodotorula graminis]
MAALLDDDVLLLILEQVDREGSHERHADLCAVSLASRRLRSLAQPLMWRRVHVRLVANFDKLLQCAARTGYGRHTRTYSVMSDGAKYVSHADALDVAALFPRITDMSIFFGHAAPVLPLLEQHTSLRSLTLFGLEDLAASFPPALPSLAELFVTVSSDLRPSDSHPDWADGTCPPVLLDLELSHKLPRHSFLAIYSDDDVKKATLIVGPLLDKIALKVRHAPPSPPDAPTVIFAINGVLDLAREHRSVDQGLDALLSACSAKRVRVEWVSAPQDDCERAFARYARALRAAAGEGGAAGRRKD